MIRNFYRITSYKLNMSKSATRGALIVFEGGDKCGKTTHTQKLVDALISQGKKALLMKFPGIQHSNKFSSVQSPESPPFYSV